MKVGDKVEFVADTFPFAKEGMEAVVTHVYYTGKRVRVKYGTKRGRADFFSDWLPVETFRKVTT